MHPIAARTYLHHARNFARSHSRQADRGGDLPNALAADASNGAERGIKSTDRLFRAASDRSVTEDYVLGVIDRLPAGLTEIYFHPAMDIGGVPPARLRSVKQKSSPALACATRSPRAEFG